MYWKLITVFFALGLSTASSAQESSTLMLSESSLVDGKRDYCLYAGLAYSPNALLTVDVPYRRESPQSLQKRLMRCMLSAEHDGYIWEDFDIEQRGTQGD